MWSAIAFVSSGFALAAFLGALAVSILRTRTLARERLIRAASARDRPDLVRDALEFFRVNADNLTKEQQYNLALEQIRARATRFKILALATCFVALLATAVAAVAIVKSGGTTLDDCREALGDSRPAECLEKSQ
jgi:hypothetical protein